MNLQRPLWFTAYALLLCAAPKTLLNYCLMKSIYSTVCHRSQTPWDDTRNSAEVGGRARRRLYCSGPAAWEFQSSSPILRAHYACSHVWVGEPEVSALAIGFRRILGLRTVAATAARWPVASILISSRSHRILITTWGSYRDTDRDDGGYQIHQH